MKHILILFLGILAFNFTGATPVNAYKIYPNITIEQGSSLYQVETINNDIVSEVPLMFQKHYTETDTSSKTIETLIYQQTVSKQFSKGNYDYLDFCQFRLHNDTDSINNSNISTTNKTRKLLKRPTRIFDKFSEHETLRTKFVLAINDICNLHILTLLHIKKHWQINTKTFNFV